jgi:hypothetical protein
VTDRLLLLLALNIAVLPGWSLWPCLLRPLVPALAVLGWLAAWARYSAAARSDEP